MKQLTSLLASGAIFAVGAVSSMAQTVGPITTTTPISTQATDWSGSLAFPQFNPSLGTLDSVTLDFVSSLSTTVTVQNTTQSSPSHGNANTEMTVSVEDGGLNFIADDPQLDINSPSFYFTLAAGQSKTSGLLSATLDSGPLSYTASDVLGEFTGHGSISLAASTETFTDLGFNGGNTASSQVTDAGLTGTVEYTYTPGAPESRASDETSTFALLALGVCALPFARRYQLQPQRQ